MNGRRYLEGRKDRCTYAESPYELWSVVADAIGLDKDLQWIARVIDEYPCIACCW